MKAMTPKGRLFMPSTDAIRASLIGARKKRHMGHEQLAKRSGLTVQAIAALECDRSISIRDLQVLCRFWGIDEPAYPWAELKKLGDLLRDHRNIAGYSRNELARIMRVSDATIKFLETASKPPSRKTLLSMFKIPELQLKWEDLAGFAGAEPEPFSESSASLTVPSATAPAIRSNSDGSSIENVEDSNEEPGDVVLDLRIAGGARAVGHLLARFLELTVGK